jgi:hypothetical protein
LTRVSVPLEVGDRFDLGMLEVLEIPASFESLTETAVPYADRGALVQLRANRKYRKGDVVLWRDVGSKGPGLDLRPGEDALLISLDGVQIDVDLLKIGNTVSLRIPSAGEQTKGGTAETQAVWIGPFRVVSIGAAVTNDVADGRLRGDARAISVAVKQDRTAGEEQLVRQLENFCDRQRTSDARLLGVKLHRAED